MPVLPTADEDYDHVAVTIVCGSLDLVFYQDDIDNGLLDDHAELGRMVAAFVRECLEEKRQTAAQSAAPDPGSH